jgi:plastocyanin
VRRLFHTFWSLLAPLALAGPLELRYVSVDGRGVAGTVVTLLSTSAERSIARPVVADMDQIDRQFVPHVLIVPTGSQVRFANSDTVSHQVYSFSAAKKFQLPLYRDKTHPPVEFGRAGVVTIGCNIHDQMRAYVFVVDAQYFGRTDAAGVLKIPVVEPGEYQLQIWHPLAREMRPVLDVRVNVTANAVPLTLRAAAPLRLRAESAIPANWDAY